LKHTNKLICLTPVKNEAWILDKFLSCASLWADHIIIADQLSTDGSREIAMKYPKVIWVENNSPGFNEPERQKLLLSEGRKIEGPKVFFTLDADEFLTANFSDSYEMEIIRNAPPGTVFRFNWVNVLPGYKRGWIIGNSPWAIADDGSEHTGHQIHSPRIPLPAHGNYIDLTDIKVLHYQYTDWARMQSKHCWYQCYECINFPEKKTVTLYRMYHHMYIYLKRRKYTVSLEDKWFDAYLKKGILMKETRQMEYWWDREVVELLLKHGTKKFIPAYIWFRNWNEILHRIKPENKSDLSDPRNFFQKLLHFYLHLSQPYRNSIPVRAVDKLLRIAGC
jgi:glycosyltransferase involved in cell wall biosynthesis